MSESSNTEITADDDPGRGPARRLVLMGVILIAVCIYGMWLMTQPWFNFSFTGNVTLADGSVSDTMTTNVDLTGRQLTEMDFSSPLPTGPKMPIGVGGLLLPVIWLVGGTIAGLAAAFLRSGFVALLGAGCFFLSYNTLGSVYETMTYDNGVMGETKSLAGFNMFAMMAIFSLMLVLAIGFQAMLINKRERAARRAASGDDSPTFMDLVSSVNLSNLARIATTVKEEAGSVKKDAKAKAAGK